MLGVFIKLAAVVGIAYVAWRVMRPRYAMKIVMDENGIKHHEGLAKRQEKQVLEFLREQVQPVRKLTIYGARHPNGYFRLVFKGQIDPGTQQRIRNFMLTVM